MLQLRHFGRYRDLTLLLTRYGLKDFRLQVQPDAALLPPPDPNQPIEQSVAARAEAFAAALKRMGPTYIKFGQILSTRPDIVPPEYVQALESLQDDVEPFSFAEVERIVESELNVRISKAFESFESTPLAAASLGQVHRATLRDGREVVVKVQRPGIREAVQKDLEVFTEIAEFLDKHNDVARKMNLIGTVQQARKTLFSELNYLQEAHNTELLRRNLAEFEQIYIPAVVHDYSTDRVLTMEMVHGKKVSKLTAIELIDHDYASLAAVLTHAYLKQICVDGFWHSDPHPGNIFLREGQLVLLDFGMVARISGEFQDQVIKLLLSVTENRGDEVAEICLKMGSTQEGFDREKFFRDVSDIVTTFHDVNVREINTGMLIYNVIAVANSNEVQVPSELAMLAKTLLHLDSITQRLDPDYDAQQVIRDYAENLVAQKLTQKFHPRNFYTAFLDLNQLTLELPRRARELINQTTSGSLTFGIKLNEAEDFLKGMHKIANRITVGLVIAALIVGSALIMRVPSRLQLFGYPLVAVLGFLAASGLGFYLVLSTLFQDARDREKTRVKRKM